MINLLHKLMCFIFPRYEHCTNLYADVLPQSYNYHCDNSDKNWERLQGSVIDYQSQKYWFMPVAVILNPARKGAK